MSRAVIAFCCLLSLAVLAAQGAPQRERLDAVDVDEVLGNERLVNAYLQCVLDDGDGRCTTEGKELKKVIPNVMASGCGRCSQRDLGRIVKVMKHITEKRPQEWAKLKAKYDPTGEYAKKHAATWRQRGVNF